MDKTSNPKDRHRPSRMLRVRGPLASQLQKLADDNASDFTEEANRAIRELLTQLGYWPRKKGTS